MMVMDSSSLSSRDRDPSIVWDLFWSNDQPIASNHAQRRRRHWQQRQKIPLGNTKCRGMAVQHDSTILYTPVVLDHITAVPQLGVWSLTTGQFLGAKPVPVRTSTTTTGTTPVAAANNPTHTQTPWNNGGGGGGWLELCPTLCRAPAELLLQQQPQQRDDDDDSEKDDMDRDTPSSEYSNHCRRHHGSKYGYWMRHWNTATGKSQWIFSSTIHSDTRGGDDDMDIDIVARW